MSDAHDESPTQTGDLGAMPDAEIEPREPNPGGVDALPEDDAVLSADLDPADNAALASDEPDPAKEAVKEAVSGSDDTDTQATAGQSDAEAEDESTD